MLRPRLATFFRGFRDRICAGLTALDGTPFREDRWNRAGGGGGITRVLENGAVFEKAGVNFSNVHGEMDPAFAKQIPGEGTAFQATGISLVLHPRSPHVPTVHANFRHLTKGDRGWFGGGADLTPYYPVLEDVVHFHKTWKAACDRHPSVADHAENEEGDATTTSSSPPAVKHEARRRHLLRLPRRRSGGDVPVRARCGERVPRFVPAHRRPSKRYMRHGRATFLSRIPPRPIR